MSTSIGLFQDPITTGALIAGLITIMFAVYLIMDILKRPEGNERMREISLAIRVGAMAYLNRQTKTISAIAALVFVVIYYSSGPAVAFGFVFGAVLSAMAGYIGMNVSVRANVRTAEAARSGMSAALSVAFKGGAVTGLMVVGLALIGVTVTYLMTGSPALTIGFGFGASLISLFARVGGGIYTKAADVGADLVGKIEKGIPEDDPRNPAVIADNVGDNVGDCAGMGADLFETYAVTLIAAMILASTSPAIVQKYGNAAVTFPFALGTVAVLATIVGTFFAWLGKSESITGALYRSQIVTSGLSAIGFWYVNEKYMNGDKAIFGAAVVGLVVTFLLTVITEYYTSTEYTPVRKVAEASETGAGTNIIMGLAMGMKSTALPVVVIVTAIFTAGWFAGIYGIAISAVAMLSSTGMIIAMDTYGPITDNAGGIAEMADLPKEVRVVTDKLDAVGNTTKAVTKGYAIGSAALAAVVLFQAYSDTIAEKAGNVIPFLITDPSLIIGLFIGAALPFLFSAFCMEAVGRAAHGIVFEVRRQFREIHGIMEGTGKPDYAACVDIVTASALKEMIVPGVMAVAAPIVVGFALGPIALAGVLGGVIVSGLMMALMMANGGATWDNAKKYIEVGNHGGKGSDAHKAAVVGDTVGDPFKDTAGPALNALIKVINTISLIIAPLIVHLM